MRAEDFGDLKKSQLVEFLARKKLVESCGPKKKGDFR